MTGRPQRTPLRAIANAAPAAADPSARTRRADGALPARTEAEYQWGGADIPLELLYERYAPYVAAIAMRLLGREGEVEDLVQDVFATAVRGLRRRRSHAEIKRWLATVTVRRCVRRLRLLTLWAWVDLAADPHWDKIADPGVGPEDRRLVAQIYRALDRVAIRDRVAWVLRYVEGESLADIAELCDCSLATAKRRIARAHAKISTAVEGGKRRGS